MTTRPLAPWQTALLTTSDVTNEAWAGIPCRHDHRREIELLEGIADDFDTHMPRDVPAYLRRMAELFKECC